MSADRRQHLCDARMPRTFASVSRSASTGYMEYVTMKIGRNAGNGRFTTVKTAKSKPKTHVVETVKTKPKK